MKEVITYTLQNSFVIWDIDNFNVNPDVLKDSLSVISVDAEICICMIGIFKNEYTIKCKSEKQILLHYFCSSIAHPL